jgi:hypothetical protein
MAANPKRIGTNFEKKVVKLLRAAFRASTNPQLHCLPDQHLFRNEDSGAGYHMKGDLVKQGLMTVAFPWTVECKKDNKMPFLDKLILERGAFFQSCWHQTCEAADHNREYPLLIWTRDRFPILCAVPVSRLEKFGDDRVHKWVNGRIVIYEFGVFSRHLVIGAENIVKNNAKPGEYWKALVRTRPGMAFLDKVE